MVVIAGQKDVGNPARNEPVQNGVSVGLKYMAQTMPKVLTITALLRSVERGSGDMQYIKAVNFAMRCAKAFNLPFIVYKVKRRWWFGYEYRCNSAESFRRFQRGDSNYIKVMMILPNGRTTQ